MYANSMFMIMPMNASFMLHILCLNILVIVSSRFYDKYVLMKMLLETGKCALYLRKSVVKTLRIL